MGKHPTQDVILLGYENGNIDLLMEGQIYNLKDIINSNIIGSKRINNIKFSGSFAYLACDFGMVVYNYKKREVKESNLLMGTGGTLLRIIDCAKFKDSIYAISSQGLKSIGVKQDFKNTTLWKTYGANQGINVAQEFQTVDSVNGTLLVTTNVALQPLINSYFPITLGLGVNKRRVREFNGKYLICGGDNILEISSDFASLEKTLDSENYKKITEPADVLYEANGNRWVADRVNGLLQITDNDTLQILPNGPLFYGSFSLANYKDEIVLHSGGYIYPSAGQAKFNGAGFAVLSDNYWTTYNRFSTPGFPKVNDFVRSFFNPFDRKLYLSSFGGGIVVKDGNSYEILNDSTTIGGLCNAYVPSDCVWNFPTDKAVAKDGVRISSAAVDASGDLWVTNVEAANGAIRRRSASDGTWSFINLPSANSKFALDVLIDQTNFKWIRMAPGKDNSNAGIWILNSDASERVALNSQSNQGALPSNDVYDIEEDKSGYIWVGTAKGLAVYYNPYNAFFTGGISASLPIFPPEAGRPVLENEVVTAIEIDGANRKWVGTRDNGVWLFNSDITKIIQHFTTENSSLISNTIYDIKINKPTGEVFFATDKGLVSYQGDASENVTAEGKLNGEACLGKEVSVFPNPVKRGFDGLVSVRGLASNSEVKFITASGKLVYQTTANGGMATWNGKTYEGKKVAPGIYLILSSTEDGKANCVTKLAILD